MESLRKLWVEWVAKTRKKMQRASKDKKITHREAMKSAALTWQTEKLKILNRRKREERKKLKEKQKANNTVEPQISKLKISN